MPTIIPRKSKKHGTRYRATVRLKGVNESRTFAKESDAKRWGSAREQEILDGIAGKLPKRTLIEGMRRYAEDVSSQKKGERWERIRLLSFEGHSFARKVMSEITAEDIAKFKTKRLESVSGASVRREMGLLSSVFEHARKEWRWVRVNPINDVKRPPDSKHRNRVFSDDEVSRLMTVMRWDGAPKTSLQWTALVLLLSLSNGFRSSEALAINEATYKPGGNIVEFPDSKNGDVRIVPLLPETIELLQIVPPTGIPISDAVRDIQFREARDACGIKDLHFHDSRHTAATKIAKLVRSGHLSVFEFCRIFGWKNINQALVYVNDSAEEIATRLRAHQESIGRVHRVASKPSAS